MDGNPSSRRAMISVLVVFVVGLVLGTLGGPLVIERVFGWHSSISGPQRGPGARQRMFQELTTTVGLTPEQQEQLKAIVADADVKYKAMFEQTRPQMDAIKQEGRARIRQMLTADQQPKYDAFIQKLDEERRRNDEERKRRNNK